MIDMSGNDLVTHIYVINIALEKCSNATSYYEMTVAVFVSTMLVTTKYKQMMEVW